MPIEPSRRLINNGDTDLECGALQRQQQSILLDSSRSSLDEDYCRRQRCDVYVHDDVLPTNYSSGGSPHVYRVDETMGGSDVPSLLRDRLKVGVVCSVEMMRFTKGLRFEMEKRQEIGIKHDGCRFSVLLLPSSGVEPDKTERH